jgi:hypothetical protein
LLLCQLLPILGAESQLVPISTLALMAVPEDVQSLKISRDLTAEKFLFLQGIIGASGSWMRWVAPEVSSNDLISPRVDFGNERRISPVPRAGSMVFVWVSAKNGELALFL